MSEKQRRELAGLSESEIQEYYREKERATPPWYTNRSKQEQLSLEFEYQSAEALLKALEAAGEEFSTPETVQLKSMLLKALGAADELQNMPRNKPKFRGQIQELFRAAAEYADQLRERGYAFNDHLYY